MMTKGGTTTVDWDDGSQELALGFTINLSRFKMLIPRASNWMDLGLDPYARTFADDLLGYMYGADTIHFDLTNMRELNTSDGVLNGPAGWNPVGGTNWELRTIWDVPVLRQKAIFYRDGKIISVADVLRLP